MYFGILMFVVGFRSEGHEDISHRLIESQYELTDRLAYYLCGKKPGKGHRLD